MKNLPVVIACCFVVFNSCKKDSFEVPQGDPNDELKAMVSVGGTPDSSFKANGNHTSFVRRVDSNYSYVDGVRRLNSIDTLINLSGSAGVYGTYNSRSIKITLINISTAGTYSLKSTNNIRQQAFCDYTIGDVFFSSVFLMYFSQSSDHPGSVTIDALSPDFIQGSFTANCSNYVDIKNATFKGTFK